MREIKFRIYDKELRVMYTPEMDAEHGNLWSLDKSQGGVVTYPNGFLMQYTGLKDKNGKEIYEGDIINVEYDMINEVGEDSRDIKEDVVVEWNYELLCQLEYDIKGIEIIGNIYETPEAL